MQLQLAAGNEHEHHDEHAIRHAATRRDDGMIYTQYLYEYADNKGRR